MKEKFKHLVDDILQGGSASHFSRMAVGNITLAVTWVMRNGTTLLLYPDGTWDITECTEFKVPD